MKEGIKMKNKWIVFMLLGLFLVGCASLGGIEQREKVYGKAVPVIKESFASKQMGYLDNLKFYLNAEDPDGDMRYIVATIEHPGMGGYPATFIPIAKENGKRLSGYIYWNTMGSSRSGWLNFLDLTVTVWIQDYAGHYSKPVSYTVSIRGPSRVESPPAGVFKENNLGPIMIRLDPFSDDDFHRMGSRY
jgi:hypothetical protein